MVLPIYGNMANSYCLRTGRLSKTLANAERRPLVRFTGIVNTAEVIIFPMHLAGTEVVRPVKIIIP